MSDAMDSDVREVIRRRIALRERDGHERLLLNHEALLTLLDAADERDRLDEIESRLSVLLWRLTNGRLSKTSYPVEFMEQEIEECLAEYHESDIRDERDQLAAAVGRVRALHVPHVCTEAPWPSPDQCLRVSVGGSCVRVGMCDDCGRLAPCMTLRYLDGTDD